MKYFSNYDDLKFYKSPESFNKYTPLEILKYAIGANMYMPATKEDIFEKLINNKFREVGAITMCCEDAIPESKVPDAEINIFKVLNNLYERSLKEENLMDRLPLIFIRVRNVEQFKALSEKLTKNHLKMLTGFNFPKFNSINGSEYYHILSKLSKEYNEILYGMPILEDKRIIYKESRIPELISIQHILNHYSKYVLNIRVGGTDFSSIYGLRRSVYNSVWDIKVVSDCLLDILNVFLRTNKYTLEELKLLNIEESNDPELIQEDELKDYVISGPVWEYFSWEEDSAELLGLKKELMLDIQNGFQGKTIIHPSQIDTVNKSYIVPYDEYMDAINIVKAEGGVFKSEGGNRMNEVSPHKRWANKIVAKSKIFGVADKTAKFFN